MVDDKDIPDELIDALMANYGKPADLLGKNGILETNSIPKTGNRVRYLLVVIVLLTLSHILWLLLMSFLT